MCLNETRDSLHGIITGKDCGQDCKVEIRLSKVPEMNLGSSVMATADDCTVTVAIACL